MQPFIHIYETQHPPARNSIADSQYSKSPNAEFKGDSDNLPSNHHNSAITSSHENKTASKGPEARPLGDFNPSSQIFDVPKDIVYNAAGPRPDQVILLTASDGKGHNSGIKNIMESTVENRRKFCEHHGYINHFINISKYDLQGAHPVSSDN